MTDLVTIAVSCGCPIEWLGGTHEGNRVPTVVHAADCPSIAGWAWPIPPEHAGPCACKRAAGYEHFTEHTPHGCSQIPVDLAERLLAVAADSFEPDPGPEYADEIIGDLEAVAAHAHRAHPDVYPVAPPN